MKLDKKYLLNYIVSAMFIIVATLFFYNLSVKVFGLNLLKGKDFYKLFKMLITLKMFKNLNNFSVFISFIGFIFVFVGGVKLSMDIEYKKNDDVSEDNKPENVNNENADKDFNLAVAKLENKEVEQSQENTDENPKSYVKEPEKPENKFSMYDKPKEEKQVEIENKTIAEVNKDMAKEVPVAVENEPVKNLVEETEKEEVDFKIDENFEREKLKNKIREMISEMDKKEKTEKIETKTDNENQDIEKEAESEKLLSKFDMSKVKGQENKTLEQESEKSEILTAEKVMGKMNYEKISEEQNMIFENVLIGAGFKLLSEIRIGETGIDYLGISKEQIAIIQVDTESGKWMANEELIGDNKYPLWYSETGNKISPFYRTTESVNTIKKLFGNDIQVNGYVCLTDNSIVNMEEAEEMATKQNIKILKLKDFEGNEFVDSLDEKFATESVTEPDQKTLNKMISILEKAEMPE